MSQACRSGSNSTKYLMTEQTQITDEQAQEMRTRLAHYERQKAYEAALQRHEVYLAIKPLVESDAFIDVHEQITAIRNDGPKDDSFFGIAIEAIYNGMTGLGLQVANWTAPVDPDAPTPVANA